MVIEGDSKFKEIIKKQFICFFLLLTINSFGQRTIEGRVVDASNVPIAQANVSIKRSDNDVIIAFGFTNKTGYFKIEGNDVGAFRLKITCLGYDDYNQKINLEKDLNFGSIILEEKKINLNEVIIKNESNGISEIGDTLRYKIERFLNGTEETLKDVIKKMPGLDIDQNGKIKANGKQIDKFLINGEEFFTNQEKLATENISSNMVKNIELIKNYREFKNIDKSKNTGVTAININIKDQFKNKFTGNVELGVGNKYRLHSTLFNFGKKVLFNLISDSNNTGELSLSFRDYLGFIDKKEEDVVGEVQYSKPEDVPRFLVVGNNVKERSSSFTAVNLKYMPSKRVQMNLYSIFNDVDQIENELSKQQFFTGLGTFYNNEIRNVKETSKFNITNIETVFKPNQKNVLTDVLSFSSLRKNEFSLINNDSNLVTNSIKNADFKIENKLNYSVIFKNQQKLSLSLKNEFSEFLNNTDIFSNNPFLDLNFQNSNYVINQEVRSKAYLNSFISKYEFKIGKVGANLFSEFSSKGSKFNTIEKQFSIFNNSVDFVCNNKTFGLETKFKVFSKTILSSSYRFSVINFQLDELSDDKILFIPQFLLKTSFSNNHTLKFSYNINSSYASAENLLTGGLIKDYRSIYYNENIAYNSLFPSCQFGVAYFYTNTAKQLTIISNVSYYKSKNALSLNIISTDSLNRIKYKLSPFEDSFNSFVFFEKTFRKVPITFKASYSYGTNSKNSFFDSVETTIGSKSNSGFISLLSRFKKTSFQTEVGIQFSNDIYYTNNLSSAVSIVNPYIETSFKIAENISMTNYFSYRKYDANTITRNYYQLSPKIRYVFPKSKVEISLIGSNILNIDNREQISVARHDNYIEENISQTLAGYFLINLKFKL